MRDLCGSGMVLSVCGGHIHIVDKNEIEVYVHMYSGPFPGFGFLT